LFPLQSIYRRTSATMDGQFESLTEVMAMIKESFAEVMRIDQAGQAGTEKSDQSATEEKKAAKSGGYFSSKKTTKTAKDEKNEKETGSKATQQANQAIEISKSLDDMMRLNIGITGGNAPLIECFLRSFRQTVDDMLRNGELHEHTDFLALELRKECPGPIKMNDVKVCLLASFAAIIPGMWNKKYEAAWSWFIDSVDVQLQESLVPAKVHEAPLKRYVKGLTNNDYQDIGQTVWRNGLFKEIPEAELRLKQSMQRFVFIAKSALEFSTSLFDEPTRIKQQLTQLGLRHILFQVDPAWFPVFADHMAKDALERSNFDNSVSEAVRWSITIMGSLMARTVTVASTPILVAAVKNDIKGLQKALAEQPRGTRAHAVLHA